MSDTEHRFPSISAEPEPRPGTDVERPSGPVPPWFRPETYVRWALTAGYVIALAGLVSTLGGGVAPWLGWIVLLLGTGAPALVFWIKHNDHQNAIDRGVRGIGTGPGASRFQGGTSLSAGPGRDDDHRADDSESDVRYP
jgi:hypothetical protein